MENRTCVRTCALISILITVGKDEDRQGSETVANVVKEAGNGIREAGHGRDQGESHDGEDKAILDEILAGFIQ
jgi:hypothetical protein